MLSELIHAFDASITFVEKSASDLSEDDLVKQPPGIPNHATWTLGHLISSCQGIAVELGVDEWLPADWDATFGYGSTPSADVTGYPSKEEMLNLLIESTNRLRSTLLALQPADLSKPLPGETFPTMGHLLVQIVVGHTAYHAGQLAVWRRALGKPSAGVFI